MQNTPTPHTNSENYRVAYRARVRRGAGKFWQWSDSVFHNQREIVRDFAMVKDDVFFTL